MDFSTKTCRGTSLIAVALLLGLALPLVASLPAAGEQQAVAAQVAQPEQRGGDGFEPVANLPPVAHEQLPAAPLVMTAYAFVWALVFGYLWTIWRRLGAIEREMRGLASRAEHVGEQR